MHRKLHISLLKADNVRAALFNDAQIARVIKRQPDALCDVVRFAFITGWRIPSEVLTLEWRQVDFNAKQMRLDPGTPKNMRAESSR